VRNQSARWRASTLSFLLPSFKKAWRRGWQTRTCAPWGCSRSYRQEAQVPSSPLTCNSPRRPSIESLAPIHPPVQIFAEGLITAPQLAQRPQPYVVRNVKGEDVSHNNKLYNLNLNATYLSQLQKSGIGYNDTLELPPGQYGLRVVVRDNISGRVGSVWAPLQVD
jgi:hypothetical protein